MEYKNICPYCKPDNNNRLLNAGTYDLSRIKVYIEEKSRALRIETYHNNGINMAGENQECVLIKYCPICGRDLVGIDTNIYNK